MLSIDEVREMAQNSRELIQVHAPSKWVTAELYRIQDKILETRLERLWSNKQLSDKSFMTALRRLTRTTFRDRVGMYAEIQSLEDEWRRIRTKQAANLPSTSQGSSPEENWLLRVVDIFKIVQRMSSIQPKGSKKSTSPSEHEARCHICKLMRDCNWTRSEMHDVFSYADDYDHAKTERQINSLIGRV